MADVIVLAEIVALGISIIDIELELLQNVKKASGASVGVVEKQKSIREAKFASRRAPKEGI